MAWRTNDGDDAGPAAPPLVFWGELSPCQHVVQIYGSDDAFLDSLEGFVGQGILAGESVIVIATPQHRRALEDRLTDGPVDLARSQTEGRYIALDADEILSRFMIGGWPDADRFALVVTDLMDRARSRSRAVRAFGEMVALLWARGHNGATIRLEHLWHTLCLEQGFSLFCAYPKSGFTQDAGDSIRQICQTHSQVCVDD